MRAALQGGKKKSTQENNENKMHDINRSYFGGMQLEVGFHETTNTKADCGQSSGKSLWM